MAKQLCIAIIAPASALLEDETEAHFRAAEGLDYLQSLGYSTILASNIQMKCIGSRRALMTSLDSDGLGTAGSVSERLLALHEIYANPEVDVILALRGGYGCIQLLSALDYGLIAKANKPLLGYSDLTALFMALATKTQLRSYHCPMLGELSTMSDLTAQSFSNLLSLLHHSRPRLQDIKPNPVSPFVPGDITVLGANLSVLAALVGTAYLPNFRGSYLALEECREAAYRVDRLLEQLRLAGVFEGIKAVLVGRPHESDFNYRVLDSLGLPIFKDLNFGHGAQNLVLAIN